MYCMSVDVCTHARKTVSECVCVRSLCHTCSVCTVCDVLHNECTEGMHLFLYIYTPVCMRAYLHTDVGAYACMCAGLRLHIHADTCLHFTYK